MKRSALGITPSRLAGIAALSVAFGLSSSIVTVIAATGLLTAVPAVHNPRTTYIGDSAKFVGTKHYGIFSSNAARSLKFAREIDYDSSS
jgi:hypothetical protein